MGTQDSGRQQPDRSLIVALVAVGVSLGGLILYTDDGAKIDALDARLTGRIDALICRIDVLSGRIDDLEGKIDDIRVFFASEHGERISFTPIKTGGPPGCRVQEVDEATGKIRQIGTLETHSGPERQAVLRIEGSDLTREWAHLGNNDTLHRARALANIVLARAGRG